MEDLPTLETARLRPLVQDDAPAVRLLYGILREEWAAGAPPAP